MLVESYASFHSKQGDIIVSVLISLVLTFTCYIFFASPGSHLTVLDLRARCEVPSLVVC